MPGSSSSFTSEVVDAASSSFWSDVSLALGSFLGASCEMWARVRA